MVNNERTAVVACYSDDTEILTEKRGFQFFKNLLPEDKVASLESGRMRFVSPTNYYEYDYKGDLLGYKGKSLDLYASVAKKLRN